MVKFYDLCQYLNTLFVDCNLLRFLAISFLFILKNIINIGLKNFLTVNIFVVVVAIFTMPKEYIP